MAQHEIPERAAERRRKSEAVALRVKHLRQVRGLSQTKLAALAQTNKLQIHRLENGHRRFTEDWVERIALALGITPQELVGPDHPSTAGKSERDMPIFNALLLTADGEVDFGASVPVQQTFRPGQLATVRDAFAIFAERVIVRRHRAGSLLWIHPHLPLSAGDCVVVYLRDGRRLLGEISTIDPESYSLLPDGVQEARKIDAKEISGIFRVLGIIDPIT